MPAKRSPADAESLAGACCICWITPVQIMATSQNSSMMP
jgi:hypothetical protein